MLYISEPFQSHLYNNKLTKLHTAIFCLANKDKDWNNNTTIEQLSKTIPHNTKTCEKVDTTYVIEVSRNGIF